ncbi:NHL repeat-containing protein [Granulicella rosea]|uniref:NHL repeat-containing protein n=1 Tax=Granulicella rosea TaxID=474952 RepID=A0A239MI50_9BACT|nr:Ig-like domain repeat protein [Granulicella rosea]SNT41479.1 NHL repeat-containing protein [Granulicella rosea]
MVRTSRYLAMFKGLAATLLVACASQLYAQSTAATSQVTLANGLGSAAGVAVDPIGNVYVADGVNGALQEYIGANGSAQALLGGLSTPGQVAVDTGRNVYVANGTAKAVYEYVSTTGTLNLNTPVSIGTGLGTVTGVAVDIAGNVYIVDATNKQVVKVAVGTKTQTVLATGLIAPKQIAVDRLGNVFIADSGANAIVYLPTGGAAATTIGSGFAAPSGVAVDVNNNLFIADTGNNAVKEIPNVAGVPTPSSQVTLAASVTAPTSVATDTRGSLYIGAGSNVFHFSFGAIYFGLLPVKQTSAVTPVTVNFTAAITPASYRVVSTGYTGLDYADAGGSTCAANTSYAAGNSCIVNVTFTPVAAGPRLGAIVFYDSSNHVLSRVFIGGGGLAPVITFDPGVFTSVTPNTNVNPISLSQPHGARFDSASNLLLADTGLNRIVIFPPSKTNPPIYNGAYTGTASVVNITTFSMNDVAINGAGDLIVPDLSTGRLTYIPYENGVWNVADLGVLGTGYSKPRSVAVDIAGNNFLADVSNKRILQITFAGVQTVVPNPAVDAIGVAVDLYGNIGLADSSGAQGVYVPVTGQAAYAVGSGMKAPWGAQFDAAGSLYISDNSVAAMYRIPNENGVLSTSDQQNLTGNKDYNFAIDPNGNIVTTPLVGTTVPVSGYNFNVLARSGLTESLGATAGQAVGTSGTVVAITVSNSGNQIPVYLQPTGISLIGDVDDFTTTGTPAKLPVYPSCNFSNNLLPGFACYIGINFSPVSPGGTRTATAFIESQQQQTPQIVMTGLATGTAPTTSAGVGLTLTTPTGSPAPGQALVVTAKANAAATGAITLYIDGTPYLAVELSSGVATFSIPAGLTVGTHALTATYAGDATYAPTTTATAATLSVVVTLATPTIMIASSGTDLNPGQSDTFTGTVVTQTGLATPTGTLTFFDGTTNLGTATLNAAGIGSISYALASGTHSITVSYSGDTVYAAGKSSAVTVNVSSFITTTTALVVTPAQPVGGYVYGTALSATATITQSSGTATPTGTMTYSLDGAISTQPVANKQATLSLNPNAGTHVLTASYSGDSNFTFSSSTVQFVTIKDTTATTLKASSTAFAAGSYVTLTANVTSLSGGIPGGVVVFKNGATTIGTVALVKGVATLTTSALPGGTDAVNATYTGDANDNASASAPITIAVAFNATSITVASAPIIIYTGVYPALTVTLANSAPSSVVVLPTGSVTFYVNGVSAGSASLSGAGNSASVNISATQFTTLFVQRFNTITAKYSGDQDYTASATVGTYQVYVAPTSGAWDGDYSISTVSAITVPLGSQTTTATVTLTPTGKYFGYVQLGCSGLPLYTNCVFQPTQLLLDGTNTPYSTTLTILSQSPTQTTQIAVKQEGIRMASLAGGAILLALVFGSFRRGRKLMRQAGVKGLLMLLFLSFGLGALSACGGHPPIATQAGTFTVNITGTGSGNINHTFATSITFK